jgi:hypothetical protein
MKRAVDDCLGGSQEEKRTSGGAGAPTPNKSQKSARSGDSPTTSTTACNANGFDKSLHVLRSVLHHQLGFPLLCYLHGSDAFRRAGVRCPELVRQVDPPAHDPPPRQPQQHNPQEGRQDRQQQPPPPPQQPRQPQPPRWGDFDTLLQEAFVDWLLRAGVQGRVPYEPALTGKLSERMNRALAPHGMTSDHNSSVRTEVETVTGRPDILVREAAANRHPLLAIEVGLSNSDWWQKMDQILKYLVGLRDNDDKFTQPILLCVLTIETDRGCVFAGARIGTFLATCTKTSPAQTKDFRLAMLRRAETTDLALLSTELAKVVRAACLLPSWVAATRQVPADENFRQEYLGPNCRRVGNKVRSHASSHLLGEVCLAPLLSTCFLLFSLWWDPTSRP